MGSRLLLADCAQAELHRWTLQDSGEIALTEFPQLRISVDEGPGRPSAMDNGETPIEKLKVVPNG